MDIKTIITSLLMLLILSTAAAEVFINEVEVSEGYPSDSADVSEQWVELYNSGKDEADITDWSITPMSDPTKEAFIGVKNISAKGFYVFALDEGWLDPDQEQLILKNDAGIEVDRTPVLIDNEADCAWGRYPDGSKNWELMQSTEGTRSSGMPCGDTEESSIDFKMDQRVSGSGFVGICNSISHGSKSTLKSKESGSGTYQSEEATRYYANLKRGSYNINLSKSSLSTRYNATEFNISPTRAVIYDTRWSESSASLGSGKSSTYVSESHIYAKSLDSNIMIDDRNFGRDASISSKFEGLGRIDSNQGNLKSSEEYIGRFEIYNDNFGSDAAKIQLSAKGQGFVSIDRTISAAGSRFGGVGKIMPYRTVGENVKTYERGTGTYQSELLIDANDSSLASSSRIPLVKNTSLTFAPINYSYTRNNPMPMSLKWEEGIQLGEKDTAFISSDFSDLSKLESEAMVLSAGEIKTSANFSGKASLEIGYRDPLDASQNFVHMRDEYVGNYSINRHYKAFPYWKGPHISIMSQGRIDPENCNIIKYTIILVNDGNDTLGPVFVRYQFPTGTSFLDSSIQPFELTTRYANWSIPYISSGESIGIDLDLQVTARKENYTSRSRAITIYQAITSTTSRDRKLRASNTSKFEADWSACGAGNLSVGFTATPNSKQPKILNYRLTLENQARESLSANITVNLPSGIDFINSTSRQENISKDTFRWTLDKLDVGKRRSISFMAEAEEDGFYVSNASVIASSRDNCRKIASATIEANQEIGSNLSSDRRPGTSNTTQFEANSGSCASGNFSVAFSATPNSKQPKVLAYRLTLENLAQENVSANITVVLPSGIDFINSTSRQKNISKNMFSWNLDKLDAGKKRSISFMAEAGEEGFYTTNASVVVYSLHDCPEIASAMVAASAIVGETIYVLTPTAWQDWCPCDENLLGSKSWNETMIARGKDLGCLCKL